MAIQKITVKFCTVPLRFFLVKTVKRKKKFFDKKCQIKWKNRRSKNFCQKIINGNKNILDSTPPSVPPTASSQPSTNPPNMSEEEIDELCHRLVRWMFGFAKETAKVLNAWVENDVLEYFLINKYVEQLEKLLE